MAGVDNGAGCLLFVRGGVLALLEGYTYGEEWPEHPVVLTIHDVQPVTEADATKGERQ